jgi:hypothetical protein
VTDPVGPAHVVNQHHVEIGDSDLPPVALLRWFGHIGIKGLGEIGVVGVSAAIANAVYHATGQRIRSLPITVDGVVTHRTRWASWPVTCGGLVQLR